MKPSSYFPAEGLGVLAWGLGFGGLGGGRLGVWGLGFGAYRVLGLGLRVSDIVPRRGTYKMVFQCR